VLFINDINALTKTIIFLIPNLLSNTKFLNTLFSNQTHNLTQLLFSIPPHILYNNTSLSTKFPETNPSNNANQSITKLQPPTNLSLFLLLAYPPRESIANILLIPQFQTKFPAQSCKIFKEYTGKLHLYFPTSTTIQNPHNPAKFPLAPQEEMQFLSLHHNTKTNKNQFEFCIQWPIQTNTKKQKTNWCQKQNIYDNHFTFASIPSYFFVEYLDD
jgi:hypothetical protein